MSDCAEVKVGQVWQDNDNRVPERIIKVIAIDNGQAICENTKTKKRTKIVLTRMRPTHNGYRLVKDV